MSERAAEKTDNRCTVCRYDYPTGGMSVGMTWGVCGQGFKVCRRCVEAGRQERRRVERESREPISSLPPVRGEQPMTKDSHGNAVDVLMSVNAVLKQQGVAFRIDIQNGQAVAVPVPECLSECSGVRGEQETITEAERHHIDGLFSDLGVKDGATLQDVQRRSHVDTPGAMRLFALREVVKVLVSKLSAPVRAEAAKTELAEMEAWKDAAYLERNQVVAALARCFPSGVARTAIEGWSDDWHGCVYIDLPTGQVSWHFHDSQAYLFADLPAYTKGWDGHTTDEKYRRLAAVSASPAREAEPLKALVEAWRYQAQKFDDKAHYRDDPYDDLAHEYRMSAKALRLRADELSAALEGAATKGQSNG